MTDLTGADPAEILAAIGKSLKPRGLQLPDGCDQLTALVSNRDRMVSIYRPSDNPIYTHGRELIATLTICTDPDGQVSIGLSHSPDDTIEIQFIDDDELEAAK